MAGLTSTTPTPTNIVVHGTSRILEVAFSTGEVFELPFELLRVYSPSAEVQGHGPGQEVLQTGKRQVDILAVEPVGHYAIQPHFSDGHRSGIFSWAYLYELGLNQSKYWNEYEIRMTIAGASRDA
ncbi:DUF971 domain-containing protein [Lampropedia puyangensis]|uniref:DUF971 domain-containing protein n=1 Tax=Lampropedia puyangensis TaxID=1330072 RepID=A0A4S8F928_9BURK|nr:DUF971 domain-containing protein [Lampropedia puyangensis]THU02774.1 DUF971 domain-containing protein [Lampropedia puyangensis]